MIVKRFFEPLLAQASYLIGCGRSGEAIVIDANRDIAKYVEAAAADDLTISCVTETHIHADFLSGSRELAARTGARLLLSDEGDAAWKYAFAVDGDLLRHGSAITVGNLSIGVEHTPGHTPEHLTFLITDGAVADAPIAAATGDFVFVGDVGRPDLLERAAKVAGTMEVGARTLFRSLRSFDARHEEWLQIWPGHGAGSSCGKGISAIPHSTLGYERRFNWAFKAQDEDAFVTEVLAGQPDPPTYFATMKRMNKEGPRVLGVLPLPPRMDDTDLPRVSARSLVIDTRPSVEYAERFLPGTVSLPLNGSFVTWAGWLVPYDVDVYLLFGEGADVRLNEAVRALALIGLDRVSGWFHESALARLPSSSLGQVPQVTPDALGRMRGDDVPVVIDVRHEHEWVEGHLPAAIHIPLGHLQERLSELPRGQRLVVQCAAGARSMIAASVLARAGVEKVSNLTGGYNAWVAAGLPTTARG